ncbi:MAG: hypothetical protein U0235_33750 [Polyangiaceae bacterium]
MDGLALAMSSSSKQLTRTATRSPRDLMCAMVAAKSSIGACLVAPLSMASATLDG